MCDSLKVLLGKEGYDIQTRPNGQEALEALIKNDFDVVLLDLVLPDMNGAEIMDHINSETGQRGSGHAKELISTGMILK
jgi:CheY-like chemotaxis protein